MPSEVRHLSFRSREIMLAITEYYYRRGLTLPAGTAARILIAEGPPVRAVLDIDTDRGEMIEVPIDAETLAASLILFCINRKIPLPAESDKRLRRLQADAVALVIVKHGRPSP
jgi:hypothetical protein